MKVSLLVSGSSILFEALTSLFGLGFVLALGVLAGTWRQHLGAFELV